MSYMTSDRYGGERDRDRSRGSRDRAGMESDYGRLNERADAEWSIGRGRGRSPPYPHRWGGPRRSRSPPMGGNIDRYIPRSPPPGGRRSRSPSRSRAFEPYSTLPSLNMPGTKPGTIDRYVPYNSGNSIFIDPYKLEHQVTYSYFSDWYHQEFPGDGPGRKDEVKAKYEEYRDDFSGRSARLFVSAHKNDEWFKERYLPGQKEIVKEKIVAYRTGAYERWRILMESGGLDAIDKESRNQGKGEENGEICEEVEEVNKGVEDGGLKPVLLIKTISPTVSRMQLEELASANLPNFQFISLSDPNPLKKFHRIGFIILAPSEPSDPNSEPAPVDEATVGLLDGKSIHDDSHGDFTCHVGIHTGPTNTKGRKVLNEAMSMPENLRKEVEYVEKAVKKFESELRGDNPEAEGPRIDGWRMIIETVEEWGAEERKKRMGSEEEGEEGGDGEVDLRILKKTIDLGVEYLRRVYFFCIYCVSSSDSIHELTRKCPGGHIRRPTPPSDYAPDQRTLNWTKTWQDKLELFTNPPEPDHEDFAARLQKLGGKPVAEAVEGELLKSVKQEDEGKYRCRVLGCTKLFKAEEFWRKHIEKKHLEWLENVEKEASLVNAYVLDACRVHPPKIEQGGQGNFNVPGGGGGAGNRAFPLLPMGAFPGGFPPANFPFTPGFIPKSNGGDLYIPSHSSFSPDGRREGGVGPMRRRDSRPPSGGPRGVSGGRERYAPYTGSRDRGERERERERRDREMREMRVGSSRAPLPSGVVGGPEAELAVLGRSMKSYMDLDAAGGGAGGIKKEVEELDY